MKRYGEDFTLTQNVMDAIATYMDDDIREDLHFKMSPCLPEEFLIAYVNRDNDFKTFLENEFGITME